MLTGPNLDKNVGHCLTSGGVHDTDIDKHGYAHVGPDNIIGYRLDETRAYLSEGVIKRGLG